MLTKRPPPRGLGGAREASTRHTFHECLSVSKSLSISLAGVYPARMMAAMKPPSTTPNTTGIQIMSLPLLRQTPCPLGAARPRWPKSGRSRHHIYATGRVEIEPKSVRFQFTRWVRHDRPRSDDIR